MLIGTIIRMRNFRHYYEADSAAKWSEHKAPKGRVMLAILLGSEDTLGEHPLDAEAVLRSLGWEHGPNSHGIQTVAATELE